MQADRRRRRFVFGIGLNKTGTTSLAQALHMLGWRCLHHPRRAIEGIQAARDAGLPPLGSLSGYDAFCDVPFDSMYEEMDRAYPDALFILTVRDLESWLESRIRHVERNRRNPEYRGDWRTVDLPAWRELWKRHHPAVRRHFRDCPDRFLELNILGGEGWEKLCPFLGVRVPERPFPYSNTSTRLGEARSMLRRLLWRTRRTWERFGPGNAS